MFCVSIANGVVQTVLNGAVSTVSIQIACKIKLSCFQAKDCSIRHKQTTFSAGVFVGS